eukprot:TRINITY_DN13256_c0_g1_i1.p1 TRINITY_DN13256_c0_g1~~TRINITY_DN13256_c0_g1_i1.p1  ORF type:complete len:474 (+),score=147.35 TRINITY_DN13256_c0_g1_i1:93-1424(+)
MAAAALPAIHQQTTSPGVVSASAVSAVGSNAGRFRDRATHIPPAGKVQSDPLSTVEMCVKHDETGRAPTPQELAAWRKSTRLAVGRVGVHPGKARDPGPPDMRFGCKNRYDDSALDLIQADKSGFFLQRQLEQREAVYASSRREPLGKSLNRGHKLPEKAAREDFRFGQATTASESAKGVIYPPNLEDEEEERKNHEMYCRSHHGYDAGEQKTRGYNWGSHAIDPKEFRFGVVERDAQREGVKQALGYAAEEPTVIVRRTLEDFKDTAHDALGTCRNQGFGEQRSLPKNFTFGKENRWDEWGSRECMRGAYSEAEQAPDKDLGKATRPGFRNEAPTDRTFGAPTIRTDIPRPRTKKVTDNNNYGDDCNAFSLLCPSKYARGNVHEEDFLVPMSREDMKAMAEKAHFELSDDEFAQAWNLASGFTSDGSVSIETFRRAVDDLGF